MRWFAWRAPEVSHSRGSLGTRSGSVYFPNQLGKQGILCELLQLCPGWAVKPSKVGWVLGLDRFGRAISSWNCLGNEAAWVLGFSFRVLSSAEGVAEHYPGVHTSIACPLQALGEKSFAAELPMACTLSLDWAGGRILIWDRLWGTRKQSLELGWL